VSQIMPITTVTIWAIKIELLLVGKHNMILLFTHVHVFSCKGESGMFVVMFQCWFLIDFLHLVYAAELRTCWMRRFVTGKSKFASISLDDNLLRVASCLTLRIVFDDNFSLPFVFNFIPYFGPNFK